MWLERNARPSTAQETMTLQLIHDEAHFSLRSRTLPFDLEPKCDENVKAPTVRLTVSR